MVDPTALVRAVDLEKRFPIGRSLFRRKPRAWLRAVDGVSLQVDAGSTLGLVGESGCGKSTLGRLLIRLLDPTGGRILMDELDVTHLKGKDLRPLRRRFQMVFQDPLGSLDPRVKIKDSVSEPLLISGLGKRRERYEKAREMMEIVGLSADGLERYPHEFSGGQRQRICIARSLTLRPDFIVADEPVSALDVSVRAQIINLFQDIQQQFGLAYLFISHDLGVVQHIADQVAVMYLGRIVEQGKAREVLKQPLHPYSKALVAAVPPARPRSARVKAVIEGDLPSPLDTPQGCPFHTRCPIAVPRCRSERPELRDVGSSRIVACHLV